MGANGQPRNNVYELKITLKKKLHFFLLALFFYLENIRKYSWGSNLGLSGLVRWHFLFLVLEKYGGRTSNCKSRTLICESRTSTNENRTLNL